MRTVKRQLSDGEADSDVLAEIADLLTDHVRFEEQELFPLVEELVPEDILKEMAVSGRRDV